MRGVGLFYGVELVKDPASKEPLVPFGAAGAAAAPMQRLVASAWRRGLYLSANNNVVRLTPPLVITEEEVDHALGVLEEVFAEADLEAARA
ncbi:MAG: aminotransferase class III-fold pyridoxal phosphate-dependent enzyme [Quadrisphaera sp.]